MKPKRVVHVGAGGWWCRDFLPPNVATGRVEVVALVDIDPAALESARAHLDLPAERGYTDLERALRENAADVCTVVVPPAHHEAVIERALAQGLDILCEKPIADTLEGSVRVAKKVAGSGRKMAVTMSHRYGPGITTLRQILRSNEFGPVSQITYQHSENWRAFKDWGDTLFRNRMADPMLVEWGVHHLDLLVDLTGSRCKELFARSWNPSWAQYAGDTATHVLMTTENGAHINYTGSVSDAAGYPPSWRVECEEASLTPGDGGIEARWKKDPVRVVPTLSRPTWGNTWLIEQFCAWLDGGEAMETEVKANLQSVALVFAAIESARTGQLVDVQALLSQYLDSNTL